jgi:hypothetical protein
MVIALALGLVEAVAFIIARPALDMLYLSNRYAVTSPNQHKQGRKECCSMKGKEGRPSRRRGKRLFLLIVFSYATPVVAVPAEGGFVIPLPYGEGVDWPKNVLAAGRATIAWQVPLRRINFDQDNELSCSRLECHSSIRLL